MYKINIIIASVLLLFSSCAQIGRPEGGPKDTLAPVITRSLPENNSIYFNKEKIVIEFDENIALKDIKDNFVVSPPSKEAPEVKTNMNKVVVKFIDSLYSNTTYTLDFANSITDLNEGNPFKNFVYTFSTGAVVDSFRVNGQLLNASDQEPVFAATILLQSDLSDTAFLKVIPHYIAKTDSSGNFSIKNIALGTYKLYALQDAKFNYTYEVGTEEGAFFPDTIVPKIEVIDKIDTIKIPEIKIDTLNLDDLVADSLKVDSITVDTTYRDSIVFSKVFDYFPKDIKLYLFKENLESQFIAEKNRTVKNKLEVVFNQDYDSLLELELIDSLGVDNWYIRERIDQKKFLYWVTDSSVYNKEEIRAVARFHNLDSLKQNIITVDTLSFTFFKDKKKKDTDTLLTIAINAQKKLVEYNEDLKLTFSAPLGDVIPDSIHLYELKTEKKDREEIPLRFQLVQDSVLERQYHILFDRKLETNYKITIDSASFKDVYDRINMEFSQEFQIQDSASYSKILLHISKIDTACIVQLLNDKKEKVLKEYFISEDSKLLFDFLKAEKYFLKVIKDKNKNKKWDTGNYSEQLLPEEVFMYYHPIQTKAGWTNDIDWELGQAESKAKETENKVDQENETKK